MDVRPSGPVSALSARTARSLSAIHLRSLTLDEAQTAHQDSESAPETPSRQTRRGSASSSSSTPENRLAASSRRSKSRSSISSSRSMPHELASAPSPTALVSDIEAPALSTRARTTSSASSTANFHYHPRHANDHVERRSADEAAQHAKKRDIRNRVTTNCRKCTAVLLATDRQNQEHILWCSDGPSRSAADIGWTVQRHHQVDPALLGQHSVKIDIWALSGKQVECSGKGKQKAVCQETAAAEGSWELTLSYSVDLNALVNLGSDPNGFPSFNPNSLILQFDTLDFFLVPETAPVASPPTTNKRVKFQHTDSDHALERSLKETKMVQAATPDDLFALLSLERHLARSKQEMHASDALTSERWEAWRLCRASGQKEHSVSFLQQSTSDVQTSNRSLNERLQTERDALAVRHERLRSARRRLEEQASDFQSCKRTTKKTIHKLNHTRTYLAQTKGRLLSVLEFIFRIEPTETSLLFSLVGLPLPNSEGLTEEHSSVLGITALLVNVLAAYLGVGLHYPLLYAGSRSLAVDGISLIKGPRSFPLYTQGVEDYRFHYAVFLLNKDIEQLCASQEVLCTDLRQTLPNLANLLLTVTSRAATAAVRHPRFKDVSSEERHERAAYEEPLHEAITSPTSPGMNGSEPDSPASTIRPQKRSKSPTPSEKIRLVSAPKTVRIEEEGSVKEMPAVKGRGSGVIKDRSLQQESIPEQGVA